MLRNLDIDLDPGLIFDTESAKKPNLRFGTWKVTSHYRSGSLTAAARELER